MVYFNKIMHRFNSPLEQFAFSTQLVIDDWHVGSNYALIIILQFIIFFSAFSLLFVGWQILTSSVSAFISWRLLRFIEVVSLSTKTEYWSLFPYQVFCIMLLGVSNIMSLTPYGFTLGSSPFFSVTLACLYFWTINVVTLTQVKWQLLMIFLPQGTPVTVAFLIVIIEFVTYLLRPFSLAIRLLANLTSGHILMCIMNAATAALMMANNGIAALLFVFSMLGFFFITLMEIVVSLLQVYVFTILSTLYYDELHSVPLDV